MGQALRPKIKLGSASLCGTETALPLWLWIRALRQYSPGQAGAFYCAGRPFSDGSEMWEKIMLCNCQPPKLYCPVNSTGTATVDMVPFAVLVAFRHEIHSLLTSTLSCSVPCLFPEEYSTWSSWLVPANFRVCRNPRGLMWNQSSRTGKLQGFISHALNISVLDKVMRWRVEAHCWIKLLGSLMSLALI